MGDAASFALGAWDQPVIGPHEDTRSADGAARDGDRLNGLRPLLARVAMRLVWDRDEADDLAQEAILRFLARRPDMPDEARTRTWLLRAVVRCSMERQRKKRRWRSVRGRLGDDRAPACPADGAETADELQRLRTELLALPPKRQAALVLHDVEGLPYAEVAAILGIAQATARAHVWAGREQLRKRMT